MKIKHLLLIFIILIYLLCDINVINNWNNTWKNNANNIDIFCGIIFIFSIMTFIFFIVLFLAVKWDNIVKFLDKRIL